MNKRFSKITKWPWHKIIAYLLVGVVIVFAIIGLLRDNLLPDDIKNKGWYTLFDKEYVKNLIISPLWVAVAFLFNLSIERENSKFKDVKNQLFGLIKGKQSVDVIDIREIMQDSYDQGSTLDEMKKEKEKINKKAGELDDNDLKS